MPDRSAVWALLMLVSGTAALLAAALTSDVVAQVLLAVSGTCSLMYALSIGWQWRRGTPLPGRVGAVLTGATRTWTRSQALIAVGCFVALGCIGLVVWRPLAFGCFVAAGAASLGIALGNTRA